MNVTDLVLKMKDSKDGDYSVPFTKARISTGGYRSSDSMKEVLDDRVTTIDFNLVALGHDEFWGRIIAALESQTPEVVLAESGSAPLTRWKKARGLDV